MQKRSETTEQQVVIEWAALSQGRHPGLKNLYHVPNEGKRSPTTAAVALSLGLRRGVPDLILDYPAGKYHGCRIEMKYTGGKLSTDQRDWLVRLQAAGYFTVICWSAQAAIKILDEYCSLAPAAAMKEDAPKYRNKHNIPELK